MKISYRTHPIINVIEKHVNPFSNTDFGSLFTREQVDKINATDTLICNARKNVQIITQPFIDAMNMAFMKLQKQEYFDEIKGAYGCFIQKNYATLYNITDKLNMQIVTYLGDTLFFNFFSKDGQASWYVDPVFLKNYNTPEQDAVRYQTVEVATKIIFLKYAELQIKELKAGQKEKGVICNYKNETKLNIKILNSTWFTTLVKSDAFKVRGHLRLQPKKKDGEWTKELIWINEFQKEGYTAPARKLKETV